LTHKFIEKAAESSLMAWPVLRKVPRLRDWVRVDCQSAQELAFAPVIRQSKVLGWERAE
jgi:hypothetical protein